MASISLPTIAAVGAAASAIGGGVAAYGSIESGQASAAASSYQSQVLANNAIINSQNAQHAKDAGEAQVTQQQLKTAATIGAIRTNEAASGLDVNSGSNLDVQSSAKELGELDALTIRNQAARQAYGYQVGATADTAQSELATAKAGSDLTAGLFGGVSSVLGGASSSANSYARFLQVGGSGSNPLTGGAGP